jgi:hypothetical protein
LESYSFVQTKNSAIVQTIEQSVDALSMEKVVKLFSAAFGHVCALKVANRFVVNSLTHELTSAEVTAFFRGTNKRSGGHPEPELEVRQSPLGSFLNGSKAN